MVRVTGGNGAVEEVGVATKVQVVVQGIRFVRVDMPFRDTGDLLQQGTIS